MKNCMKSHIGGKAENHWLRVLSPPSFSPQSIPDFLFSSGLSLNVEAQDLRYIASRRRLPTLNFTSLCEAKGHVCLPPTFSNVTKKLSHLDLPQGFLRPLLARAVLVDAPLYSSEL